MNRSRVLAVLGWGGVAAVLLGVALIALAPHTPRITDRSDSAPPKGTIEVTKQKQRISVPPDRPYGIWADDENNSGYSNNCSIIDDDGRPIDLKLFEGSAVSDSQSDFAQFDYAFNTGSGKLTVLNCIDSEARFSVRPLERTPPGWPEHGEPDIWPRFAPMLLLSLTGVLLAQLGVSLLVASLVIRFAWRKPTAP